MICFHSLNYWYLQQPEVKNSQRAGGCDLLSFFELLIFTTTISNSSASIRVLWFAFILWTTDIYNNLAIANNIILHVVICFHSLNYWYLQQHYLNHSDNYESCDLLSFFELLIFTTTAIQLRVAENLLWFAFILWTTDIYNNPL